MTSAKTDAGVFVLGRDVVPDRITDNPPGDPKPEVNNPANADRIHTVLTPNLLSARWTGGTPNAITLIEMWQAAQAGDAISPFGLYVSEANRLERLSGDLTRGDGAEAALELDKFIAKVGGSANVEAQWKQLILGYARALRNTI